MARKIIGWVMVLTVIGMLFSMFCVEVGFMNATIIWFIAGILAGLVVVGVLMAID